VDVERVALLVEGSANFGVLAVIVFGLRWIVQFVFQFRGTQHVSLRKIGFGWRSAFSAAIPAPSCITALATGLSDAFPQLFLLMGDMTDGGHYIP
jgi:hypothetical protein